MLHMDGESASIGIGAMIVFIALILVAAVASTIIIKSVEELSQTVEDSLGERDYSKIEARSVYVFLHEPCWQSLTSEESDCPSNQAYGHHEMEMHFQLEGDVAIPASSIFYHISCPEPRSSVPTRISGFDEDNSRTWDSRHSSADGWSSAPFNQGGVVLPGESMRTDVVAIDTLQPETTYAVMLDLYDNKNTLTNADDEGCVIPVDYRMRLVISIEGGMESYYVIKCPDNYIATGCL